MFQGSRYFFDDETASFRLPAAPPGWCVRVAVLGPRGASLRARFSDPGLDVAARAVSHAGALQLSRCQEGAVRLVVTNESGRGAVEVLSVSHAPTLSLAPLGALLPERGTPREGPPEPALPIHLAAPESRVRAAAAHALAAGATDGDQKRVRSAGPASQVRLRLRPGCTTITVVATALGHAEAEAVDVDAEARDDALVARDKSDAPDARLEPCTTTTKDITVSVTGAPEGSELVLVSARFPVRDAVPALFGEDARLRMDRALRKRRASVQGAPVFVAQGVTGTTRVPVPLDGQSCYVVVGAVSHGAPRGLGLHVEGGPLEASDERGASDDAGVVAFCASRERVARLTVVARGAQVRWGLAVFRVPSRAAKAATP
ncbi:MAG TPA: hypothetical protein PLR99_24365 [Polyangiaceae bacterium]|nr:hypothetical protein [Polyangiaceae bacterium]